MWFTFRPATSSRCGILTPMMICQLLSIPALAQEVVVADGDFNISASANTIDFGIATDSDTDLNNQDFQSFETIMVPQIRSVSANDPDSAASAAASSVVSVAEFLEENGQLEGTLTANGASSGISDGQGVGGSGTAATTFELEFDVIGAPAIITLSGMANTVMTPGDLFNARVELSLQSGGRGIGKGSQPLIDVVATSPPREPEDSGNRTYSESLSLSEGRYTLRLQATSFAGSDTTGSYEFTLGLLIQPDPDTNEGSGEEFFWATNDGDFDTAENWEPQQVPGAGNIAVFDRDATYAVTLANPEVARMFFERGTVTLDGSTLMASGGSMENPAVIVGNSTLDTATLRAFIGNVSADYTTIGRAAGTNGILEITGTTQWADGGEFVVGGSGTGRVTLDAETNLTVEDLILGSNAGASGTLDIDGDDGTDPDLLTVLGESNIGFAGTGTLSLNNAAMRTEFLANIGSEAGSQGTVTLEESSQFAFWQFGGSIVVGAGGTGTLEVLQASQLRALEGTTPDIDIAFSTGSTGTVNVTGDQALLLTGGAIVVGRGGDGTLTVGPDALFGSGSLTIGPVDPAKGDTAIGRFVIEGSGVETDVPQVEVTGDLAVGSHGRGTLVANAEALIQSDTGNIGSRASGDATVTIINSDWFAGERVLVGLAERNENDEVIGTAGVGTIVLSNGGIETPIFICDPGSTVAGTGDIIVTVAGTTDCTLTPGVAVDDGGQAKQEDSIGELMLGGDWTFNGATLQIDVASPANGDLIMIAGNADLTNTTIIFNFIEGYLPQAGDNLPFILADGTLTIDNNTTLQYTGAAEGFDFDVNAENGMLTFQAQNNAQPEGGEGEGEGEGEGDTEGTGETGGCAAGSGPTGATNGDLLGQVIVVLALLSLRQRRYAKIQGNRTI